MPYYTAIVTLLAVAFYFFLATRVSAAHSSFNVRPPGNDREPRFRANFPRSYEHARMAANFLGAAVALCNLLERRRRNSARCRLDRRPCCVFRRLK